MQCSALVQSRHAAFTLKDLAAHARAPERKVGFERVRSQSHTGERPAVCSALLASTKTNGSWCAVPSRATPRAPSPHLPPPPPPRCRLESGNGSKLFLDFLQRESLHNIQHFDFRGGTSLLLVQKTGHKNVSQVLSVLVCFLYTYLRLIHGALGIYLISIVNVVMHTNSLLSSVLLHAAPRQCGGGGEAQ